MTIGRGLGAALVISVLGLAFTEAAGGGKPQAAADRATGMKIESFTLSDFRGKEHRLADLADAKVVVVAFLGCECPLAKLYAPRLGALAKEYEPRGVRFLGINANQQDNLTEIAAFARDLAISFPLLKDPGNEVADRFGAQRTPEVFVLDAERAVSYRGRIDDQYGIGIQRPKSTRDDLKIALDELLAGADVTEPVTTAPGCLIGRANKRPPTGDVTYSKQISRILADRCVNCHRPGEIAPFTLMSYSDTVGWAETMLEVIEERRMPPWSANPEYGHFRNDARMTDNEIALFRAWVANGTPEGDPADLPEPRHYTEGWFIGEPDLVVKMADKPFPVPAEGVVQYQHIEVDPGFTEDKWVKATEARPGNPAVVHHIIVFVRPPGMTGLPFMGELVGGYAPGMPPASGYEGMAVLIPKGSKLVFQMHYTPNGTATEDLSYVGFKFADPAEVKERVKAGMAANLNINIPPGEANYPLGSKYKFRHDSLVVSLMPHMHLRGKAFRYEAVYPDGTREILLDVPRYDFNWQLRYEFTEPKRMPKGTELVCSATFDNSADNLANPDPSTRVRWGDQTWEEMMIGWFTMTVPKDRSKTN